jgi:hypothetical protein
VQREFALGRFHLEVTRILAEIDAQIAKLQQARALLAGTTSSAPAPSVKKSVGRPRKIVAAPAKKTSAKRSLSPEARKRIADAQKRRWADRRKASA